MSERVVLHIGAMKTGTTYLQSVLQSNAEPLRAQGCDFIGTRFSVQSKAVRQAFTRPREGGGLERWRGLAEQARSAEAPTAVFSMEFLSFASPRQVEKLLRPFDGARVEVVLTVRDQLRVIPAQWQTYCRNQGTSSWQDYLREIQPTRVPVLKELRARTRAYSTFHRAQELVPILTRWDDSPRVSRVHVVTVPGAEAPRDELWRRFAQVLEVDPEVADVSATSDNVSLGYGSCDFLRRLNRHLRGVPPKSYRKVLRAVARDVLADLRHEESRPALDRRGAALGADINRQVREAVPGAGWALHGSLEDLTVPTQVDAYPKAAGGVPQAEAMAAARAVWDSLPGAAGEVPADLEGLVAGVAARLRREHGW